jgi:hypothetical protein
VVKNVKKNILLIIIFSTAMAFACSKRIELTRWPEPFMLVNLNPFMDLDDGAYQDIDFDFSSINHWNPSAKKFRKDGLDRFYYSELDSNTLVFITIALGMGKETSNTPALYFIRPCSTDEECVAYEKEHPITEVFKSEFMRLQREGFYQTSQEYADSISNYIIDLFKSYSDSTGRKIYDGLVYNNRCWLGNDYGSGEPKYYDLIEVASIPCPMIPSAVRAEFDSCNAMLDAQEIKISSLPQMGSAHLDIQGRQISVSGIEGPTEITIFSLMGQTLEQHHVSGKNATVVTDIPTGSYIVQARSRNNSIVQKMDIR